MAFQAIPVCCTRKYRLSAFGGTLAFIVTAAISIGGCQTSPMTQPPGAILEVNVTAKPGRVNGQPDFAAVADRRRRVTLSAGIGPARAGALGDGLEGLIARIALAQLGFVAA